MKKKTLLLFLSAVLTCTMLTGCGGKDDDVAPVVTDISESDETSETTLGAPPEAVFKKLNDFVEFGVKLEVLYKLLLG